MNNLKKTLFFLLAFTSLNANKRSIKYNSIIPTAEEIKLINKENHKEYAHLTPDFKQAITQIYKDMPTNSWSHAFKALCDYIKNDGSISYLQPTANVVNECLKILEKNHYKYNHYKELKPIIVSYQKELESGQAYSSSKEDQESSIIVESEQQEIIPTRSRIDLLDKDNYEQANKNESEKIIDIEELNIHEKKIYTIYCKLFVKEYLKNLEI